MEQQDNPSTPPSSTEENADIHTPEDPQQIIEELQQSLAAQKDQVLRARAEFENAKKRLIKEKEDFIRYASEKLLTELFPVLDSFEMTQKHLESFDGSESIRSGIDLIEKQLTDILKKNGLEEVNGLGELFDPNWHEAIGQVEDPQVASGHIAAVHRKGYKLATRLLRPALVTVAK